MSWQSLVCLKPACSGLKYVESERELLFNSDQYHIFSAADLSYLWRKSLALGGSRCEFNKLNKKPLPSVTKRNIILKKIL